MNKDSKHRKTFQKIAEKAEQELGDSLLKLYLYGSVARGEEDQKSDLDIFAVVKEKEEKKWLQKKASEIGVDNNTLVSAVVKTEENYQKMKDSSYGREVRETGIAYV